MMKKILVLLASAVVSTSVMAANMNIAVINVHKILQNAPQVKAMQMKLKKEFTPDQKNLITAQKQLTNDVKKLNRNASVMKADQKNALQQKIVREQQQLQQMQAVFQQKVTKAQNDAMQSILSDIKSAVSKVAVKHHYSMVITKAALAYNISSLDVTDQVIAELK